MNKKPFSISENPHITMGFLALILVICTVFVYWNISTYDFIYFDDNLYILETPNIKDGISLKNIFWAFGFSENAIRFYWHPLTLISHQLDCQFFGLDAGAHHLINLAIHIANALLLFSIFQLMTRSTWKSFFAAALFAVHPINVDSVAWIAERKNVLSTFFWLLTMLAHTYYAEKPSLKKYIWVVIPLILGMLSKPMLVTLPFVLLLLDFWPLGRLKIFSKNPNSMETRKASLFQVSSIHKLVLEKLPLIGIVFIFTSISIYSSHINKIIVTGDYVPIMLRLENAVVTYMKYIGKIVWPINFAIYYPFPDTIPLWQVITASAAIAGITGFALALAKKAPYIIVGWLWFIGTLSPVSGIFQHGLWPEMADRWAYIPAIGLFIIIAWGRAALMENLPRRNLLAPLLIALILCVLITISRNQTSYWKNEKTLFSHSLKTTKGNYLNHLHLGKVFADEGNMNQAVYHYFQCLKFQNHPAAHFGLGYIFMNEGNIDQAIYHYRQGLKIEKNVDAYNNLGSALAVKGRVEESITQLKTAIEIKPEIDTAYYTLATVLADAGRLDESITYFQTALDINPTNSNAHNNLATVLAEKKLFDDAVFHLNQALAIDPLHVNANLNLGKTYIEQGRMDLAMSHYHKMLTTDPAPAQFIRVGKSLIELNQLIAAEKIFNMAIKNYPKEVWGYSNLSYVLAKENKIPEAIDCLNKILSIDPKNETARGTIAYLKSLPKDTPKER